MTITIENLDSELNNIPPLPATVSDVYLALQNENINFAEIEQHLTRDPALAIRVLRIANSPFYGLSGKIDNLKDACVVLGIYTTRNIVLAAGIIKHLTLGKSNHLDFIALWHHALGAGVAAKVLAKETRINPQMVFTAGLLHDLGKVILDIYYTQEYAQVMAHRGRVNCLIREAESAVLGFDHALVGAKIARYWSLPASIADAIEKHHCTNVETTTKEANLIQVAETVSRRLKFGYPGDPLVPSFNTTVLQRLELDIPTIEQHYQEIEKQFHQVSDSFF
jgi:putative nucleotidyltransferase with HDIG domain